MVIGLGVDILQNDRIESMINKYGDKFLSKFFSHNELDFINKTQNKNQRYASNFAVKEAFAKAMGTGFRAGLRLSDIEVKRDNLGKPYIDLIGQVKKIVKEKGINKIHTTISHEKEYSVAVVIFEG